MATLFKHLLEADAAVTAVSISNPGRTGSANKERIASHGWIDQGHLTLSGDARIGRLRAEADIVASVSRIIEDHARLASLNAQTFVYHTPAFEAASQSSSPYMMQMESWSRRENTHRAAIRARIEFLRDDAIEDGAHFHEASAELLLTFLDELSADAKPAIGLGASGNLQAIWQNDRQDRIAIQFFPDGRLQYVILRDRDGRTHDSSGHDTAVTIKRIVGALGLRSLWFHGEG